MAYIFAGTKCFNMDIPHTSGGRLRKDFLKGKMDPPLARVGISRSDNTICHGLGESPPTHPTSFISFHSIQKYSTSGHQWHWPVFVFSYLYLYSFPFFVSLQWNHRPLFGSLIFVFVFVLWLYLYFILFPFLLVCNSMIGLFVFPQTEIRGGFLSHKRTIHFRPSPATTNICICICICICNLSVRNKCSMCDKSGDKNLYKQSAFFR